MKKKTIYLALILAAGISGCGNGSEVESESNTILTESEILSDADTKESDEIETLYTEATKLKPEEVFLSDLAGKTTFVNDYEAINDTALLLSLQDALKDMSLHDTHLPFVGEDIKVSPVTDGYNVETEYFLVNQYNYKLKMSVSYDDTSSEFSINSLELDGVSIEIPETDSNKEKKEDSEALSSEVKTTETMTDEIEDAPADRTGVSGKSNKNIADLHVSYSDSYRNDETGKWRLAKIADSINVEEYALSYYKQYFKSDDEVHFIIDFTLKTTNVVTCMGGILDVSTYEYVDGEEHDAKSAPGGMLLSQNWVYMDNGDIEKIQ